MPFGEVKPWIVAMFYDGPPGVALRLPCHERAGVRAVRPRGPAWDWSPTKRALRQKAEKRKDPKRDLFEPLTFLEHCHGLGAGGIQVCSATGMRSTRRDFAAGRKSMGCTSRGSPARRGTRPTWPASTPPCGRRLRPA